VSIALVTEQFCVSLVSTYCFANCYIHRFHLKKRHSPFNERSNVNHYLHLQPAHPYCCTIAYRITQVPVIANQLRIKTPRRFCQNLQDSTTIVGTRLHSFGRQYLANSSASTSLKKPSSSVNCILLLLVTRRLVSIGTLSSKNTTVITLTFKSISYLLTSTLTTSLTSPSPTLSSTSASNSAIDIPSTLIINICHSPI
jgi:hypothetical protein